jgi:response regulator RpfG family c-di-GMP phosphodiesterase
MRKAVLIEKDPEIRKLYELNLDLYLGMEVLLVNDADELSNYLRKKKDVSLIISTDKIGDENTIMKVFYFVNAQKLDIPVILLGSEPKLVDNIKQFDPKNWREVIRTAGKLLGITAEEMATLEVPNYYPIPLRSFLAITKSASDVYLQTQKSALGHPTDQHLKKIIAENQEYKKEMIEELLLNDIQTLFIPSKDRLKFVNHLSDEIHQKLAKAGHTGNTSEDIANSSQAFYAVREMLEMTGLSARAIELAKNSIDIMTKTVQQTNGISDLLDILERDKLGYLYKHVILIATIAHYTIAEMEWGSKEQQDKICFVSFFHDISIPDDQMAKVQNLKQLKSEGFKPTQEKKILNHALYGSELLKSYPKLPIGADVIILQHHCQLNGIGFPNSLSNRVTPLAIVFRVVEDFVEILLSVKKEYFVKNNVIKTLRQVYNKGQYRKVVDAIEKANCGL